MGKHSPNLLTAVHLGVSVGDGAVVLAHVVAFKPYVRVGVGCEIEEPRVSVGLRSGCELLVSSEDAEVVLITDGG